LKTIVTFQCDLCGHVYEKAEDAQKCEARGIVRLPLYRKGQFVLVTADIKQNFANPVKALIASVDVHEDWEHSCHDSERLIVYEIAIRVSVSPYDKKTGFDPIKFFDIAEQDILGRLNPKTKKASKPRRRKGVTSFNEYYTLVDNSVNYHQYQNRLRSMRRAK